MGMSEDDLRGNFPSLLGEAFNGSNQQTQTEDPPYNPNVTDADVEAYIARHGGVAGPGPVNSGQQPRPPQFLPGQGQHVPPSGGTEGDEGVPPPPPPQPPVTEPGAGEQVGEPGQTTPAPGFEEWQRLQQESQPQPPPPPSDFEVDGQRIPIDRVRAFQTLYERIQQDPGLQQTLQDYLTRPPAAAQPPQVAPGSYTPGPYGPGQPGFQPPYQGIDPSDPAVQAIAPWMAQTQQQLNELSNLQRQQAQQWERQVAQQNEAQIQLAMNRFKADHQLQDADMQKIRKAAADTVNFDALVAQTGDTQTAALRAFDVAMNNFPEYRHAEYQRWLQSQRDQAQHRQKLAGVGGNSGSVPRQQQPSRDPKKNLMNEVQDMLQGNWSPPGN